MVLFNSCRKAEEKVLPENHQPQKVQNRLGVQLKNPYKKTLMDSAYQLVKENNPDLPNLIIKTTHLYVKFSPLDSLQAEALSCDTLFSLYNYPLDYKYEVGQDPDEFYEPAEDRMKNKLPPVQYASIPVGYTMPLNIPYEVLAELYIPDLDKTISDEQGVKTEYETVVDSLEIRAFNLTGNDIDEEDEQIAGRPTTKSHRRRFNPAGRVQREDNVIGTVPVHGCKVRARRWFNTQTTLTDVNGNYNITYRFRRPVNYSIDWSRNDFAIRRSQWFGAYYRGPKRRGNWNPNFSRSLNERQLHFATIFQAAHDYYYNRMVDIRTPPVKRWLRKLVISAMERNSSDSGATGDFAAWRWWISWPDIRIFNPGAQTQDTYATTIHELAHASHWAMNNVPLYCVRSVVVESWARAVEIMFTSQRYRNYGMVNFLYGGGWQDVPSSNANIMRGYTQVGFDLVDDQNQRFVRANRNINEDRLFANDNVTGFTLREVENAVRNARTLEDWRNAMVNINPNIRAIDLNELFNFYMNLNISACPGCFMCTY
ncbi:MAG: hypothetical protein EAZ85_05890 [Bacteroidetes bacterium]|nr:MAG: hypothetical protein EAZ85_05890 [Bacteroidota bacterium]TAG90120.1 MAG: hypothetical protein EAZ20_05005 [Bacteroidota bacterium]